MLEFYAKMNINNATTAYKGLSNDCFRLDYSEENGRIKGVFTAKRNMILIEARLTCSMRFGENDLFFANGYQSWTTSREYSKSDKAEGIMRVSNITGYTRSLTGIAGDYSFTDYGKRGCFHSHTYCYIRKKNSEDIVLYGSRSEENGFTIFEADMVRGGFVIKKDVSGLTLTAGREYTLFDIAVIKDEYNKAFDRYFFDFMGLKKPRLSHLSGYTSWYNYFQNINEEIILRDLNSLQRAECADVFQVDDGYESAVGDWLIPDSKKFPNGMKYIADKIHEKNFGAGIWLAPFNAQKSSKILKKHPDWVIKDNIHGNPLLGCVGWGGAYTFDIYNEEFREYLKEVFDTVFNDWGFDMVKLDFLYSQCMQPRNGKTRGEIMCDAVKLLRSLCGDKLILGCGVPLGACMGVFDACRIGCDVDKSYKSALNLLGVNREVPSSPNAINNTIFRRHLDGRAFLNDPDVFFLRKNNISYTEEQKLLHGKVNALCGSVQFVSDDMGGYDSKTLEIVKKLFDKRQGKVTSAQYESAEVVRLCFKEKGREKSLTFNIKNGKSNIGDVF